MCSVRPLAFNLPSHRKNDMLPSEHVRYSQWKTHDTNSVQNIIICKAGLNVHLQGNLLLFCCCHGYPCILAPMRVLFISHVASQQPQMACRMCPLKPAFSTDTFQCSLTMLCSRFRLKGLPGVGSILVHVSKQNKSRHYQKVADVKDHHYEWVDDLCIFKPSVSNQREWL